jgi:hypothetical protein
MAEYVCDMNRSAIVDDRDRRRVDTVITRFSSRRVCGLRAR